jgi:hypothetical protein
LTACLEKAVLSEKMIE